MARKMASMSCQFYLTVVFLLVLIAVQCTCNLLDDMEMARYNQEYKRSRVGCKGCTNMSCVRTCTMGRKRSFSLEPEDHETVSKDEYTPRISSQTCLLDSVFESLSEEGRDRVMKALLESE
ncbi:uncharacterized protein LOC105446303 [Strongylocentrotus purpuratus]|uniref:Uncharacterized protein n=1 Tax=Strongylocentrotus purpuratus TaxID=7668 RepID=A0A7M7NWB5_STRPU|nr:uncharacterized protein LOC105446301 [Strongylocentrotus purpuratus]XP_030841511.1 uncharacterized protein LOC105446303 [Strongylocentrotus purpuratus]